MLALMLVVQFGMLSITFPLAELLTDTPLLKIDHAAHWYRITVAGNLAADAVTSAYDPFFNAGTVAGTVANPAAKVPAALLIALDPWLDATTVWKFYVFTLGLAAALCVPIAMLSLRLAAGAVFAGGLWALLLWWVSVFHWYHTAGLVSFVFSAYLALPFIAAIHAYLHGSGGWLSLIGLGLLGAFGLLCHPLFALPVALWTGVHILTNANDLRWARILPLLIVVPAISVLPNLFWIFEVFVEEPLTVRSVSVNHQVHVGIDKLWKEALGLWGGVSQGSKLYPLLLLGTLGFLSLARRSPHWRLGLSFTIAGLAWIVYASFGAAIPLLAYLTQPNRFAPVGYLFLIIPASLGLSAALERARDAARTAITRRFAAATIAGLAVLTVVNINELRREISFDENGRYGLPPPQVLGPGPYTRFLMQWLERDTRATARVLFENSRGRIYDDAQIPGYLAYNTQREFIGGHYLDSYFADFVDGEVFGRQISDFTPSAFREYLELYNIGWVVAHSPSSKRYLARVPGLIATGEFRELVTYTVVRPHSFFIEGDGEVTARAHNRLELSGLRGDTVILKYHYMRGMRAQPITTLEPVYFGDDPNPFIRLPDPPPDVVLSVR